MGLFGKKCPKCGSGSINKVKSSIGQKMHRVLMGPYAMFTKAPKTLNVCKDCGFSWEDR